MARSSGPSGTSIFGPKPTPSSPPRAPTKYAVGGGCKMFSTSGGSGAAPYTQGKRHVGLHIADTSRFSCPSTTCPTGQACLPWVATEGNKVTIECGCIVVGSPRVLPPTYVPAPSTGHSSGGSSPAPIAPGYGFSRPYYPPYNPPPPYRPPPVPWRWFPTPTPNYGGGGYGGGGYSAPCPSGG